MGAPTVPIPDPRAARLTPPDEAEARLIARGILTAAAADDGPTPFQRVLVSALTSAMTGHRFDPDGLDALAGDDLARSLALRDEPFRRRILQNALLSGLVLIPLPAVVVERLRALAAAFGVDDAMLDVAQQLSHGALGLAAIDFDRNGYTATLDDAALRRMGTPAARDDAWQLAVDDPDLHRRWTALGDLPDDSLGKRVFWFYRARGFAFPGAPGSAPPLLAQHDWVHVVADYGTTLENELEVFALIARANDDARAFSLLAMVVSLFETGYLSAGAGLFAASPGHLRTEAMAIRLADAMRRGALARTVDDTSVDFLTTDWFALAPMPLAEVRAHFALTGPSDAARAAGSVGPWERGGISPFQWSAGQAAAVAAGRPYDPHGAELDA